jgi:hypothetical protein
MTEMGQTLPSGDYSGNDRFWVVASSPNPTLGTRRVRLESNPQQTFSLLGGRGSLCPETAIGARHRVRLN